MALLTPPFTPEQFLEVFGRYNADVWPLQLVLEALGVLAVALLPLRRPWSDRAIAFILALLWLWMALVYHLLFFIDINPAALYFGIAFIVAGALFAATGVYGTRLSFENPGGARLWAGVALLAYGLAAYPLLSLYLGRYPQVPTFGLPCPTTIFTLGLACFLRRPYPRIVLAIPIAWTAIGATAAFQLGVVQDLGLLVAGLAGLWLVLTPRAPAARESPA